MQRKFLFIFCLMTLPLYVFSQMQSVISTSTERVLDGVNVSSEKVKTQTLDDKRIITSHDTRFYLTEDGTTTVKIADVFMDIYDFKIYNDVVYFCGGNYIAYIPLATLFTTTTTFTPFVFIDMQFINNIDVYMCSDGTTTVVTTGMDVNNDFYIFDLNLSTAVCTKIQAKKYLDEIVVTRNYVVALEYTTSKNFNLIRYPKGNPYNVDGYTYEYLNSGYEFHGGYDATYIDKLRPEYLMTTLDKDKNYVCVAVGLAGDYYNDPATNVGHSVGVFNIDISNFMLNAAQKISTYGKPLLKDMKYSVVDDELLILLNDDYFDPNVIPYINYGTFALACADIIYKINPFSTTGNELVIYPFNNSIEGMENLNSLTLYENKFYVAAGKHASTGGLYWFDEYIVPLTHPSPCFTTGKCIISPDVLGLVGGFSYSAVNNAYITYPLTTRVLSAKYATICQ
ncbi:MAG: hypothetical protein IJ213_09835 [Bacteroidales bacterium]|nr:hypothetical protein [Bacteroidales bacterium]